MFQLISLLIARQSVSLTAEMNVEPDRFFRPASPHKRQTSVKTADIFNVSTTTDRQVQSPRRTPLQQNRKIFDLGDIRAELPRSRTASPQRFEDTKGRLFGENSHNSPRKCRVTDNTRSTVFSTESHCPTVVENGTSEEVGSNNGNQPDSSAQSESNGPKKPPRSDTSGIFQKISP